MGEHRAGSGTAQGGRGTGLTEAPLDAGRSVCRVVPDVPALDRAFDYSVPETLVDDVFVGSLVRVRLRNRRVRGWVVELDVRSEAAPAALQPLLSVASAGPPAEVVQLCTWGAWRWAGSRVAMLRAATPDNLVHDHRAPEPDAAVYPAREAPIPLPAGNRRVIRWPPTSSRLDLIRSLVASEGSTIVLAPDPGDDEELTALLESDGRHVLGWRADLPAAARTIAWDAARLGACVVLGGRSAVFAPVPDLAAIVLLDDLDEALKEERVPAWHARELAAERARRASARFDVVTPAPSVEVVEPADAFAALEPPQEAAGWPRIEVVDLRQEPPGTGLLSTRLGAALTAAVADGGMAVCVVNRRGRARLLACRSCGELARCSACGAAVADVDGALVCPRCGTARPMVCAVCTSTQLRAVHPGVVKVREEIADLVPSARVVALDAASAPLPPCDIVVGTEAALHRARYRERPSVRLVVFLEFDQELLAARYRAAEQALWLLVRAGRLVGAPRDGGAVLVQTRVPDDLVLQAAIEGRPELVGQMERARRLELALPPFGGLAELSGASDAVAAAGQALALVLDVRGPTAGTGATATALLRAASTEHLCDALASVDLDAARAIGRLRIDVDPLRS